MSIAPNDDDPYWGPGPEHPQGTAVLGDREVQVDEPLVPLIEVLHRRGITTKFSCQDVTPAHGAWRDEPEKQRLYIVFPDVEELRKLLPLLAGSDELVRSIHPCLGSPRWEYGLSIQGGPTDPSEREPDLRLQASIFIPFEQLDLLVATLSQE